MINTPQAWLAEVGIERFRLRRQPERQRSVLQTQQVSVATETAVLEPPRGDLDTVVEWTARIRNYRTVATLTCFDETLSASDFKMLERLSNDIGTAVNGMAIQPLVQEQRFSTLGTDLIDAERVQRWLQDLPGSVVLLAGNCTAFSNLLIRAGQIREPAPILISGILSASEMLEKKRQLWRALSPQIH